MADLSYEPVVQKLRDTFASGRSKSIDFRRTQLKALARLYEENTPALLDALAKDLHKSKQESITMEIEILLNDIRGTLANLDEWANYELPSKSIVNILDSVRIYRDPYGVVLIIGAWNYPLQLLLLPLAGAIAAGNCAVVKPSEISEATAQLVANLIPKYLDNDCYQVILGGAPETTTLLRSRFDYIFYTGSTAVGRIIQTAAAAHLTPTTLELGGKSPVYLDSSVALYTAVKRLLWGKCVNAGQTCIAPDYLLCSREMQAKVVEMAKQILAEFYGADVRQSPDYCRIVSDRHYQRLKKILDSCGNIALGGVCDASERYISPTIITDVTATDLVMQEELFGPLLPIVPVKSVHEAIAFINAREKPLSLYIFSTNRRDVDALLSQTSSGGVCINDTVMHFACEGVPFGGVGHSGIGRYHGKYTFDTFSHLKTCLVKGYSGLGERIASARYPPYSNGKIAFLNALLKRRRLPLRGAWLKRAVIFGLGVVAASYYKQLLDAVK